MSLHASVWSGASTGMKLKCVLDRVLLMLAGSVPTFGTWKYRETTSQIAAASAASLLPSFPSFPKIR